MRQSLYSLREGRSRSVCKERATKMNSYLRINENVSKTLTIFLLFKPFIVVIFLNLSAHLFTDFFGIFNVDETQYNY